MIKDLVVRLALRLGWYQTPEFWGEVSKSKHFWVRTHRGSIYEFRKTSPTDYYVKRRRGQEVVAFNVTYVVAQSGSSRGWGAMDQLMVLIGPNYWYTTSPIDEHGFGELPQLREQIIPVTETPGWTR